MPKDYADINFVFTIMSYKSLLTNHFGKMFIPNLLNFKKIF